MGIAKRIIRLPHSLTAQYSASILILRRRMDLTSRGRGRGATEMLAGSSGRGWYVRSPRCHKSLLEVRMKQSGAVHPGLAHPLDRTLLLDECFWLGDTRVRQRHFQDGQ